MKLFRNLFKKNKEKEVIEEVVQDELHKLPKCNYCGNYIREYEQTKTYSKEKYHIQCFRKVKKQAMRLAKNGDVTALGYFKS